MWGSAWSQVQTALIHIMGITKPNKLIKTEIITYSSTAQILKDPTTGSIKSMRAGGGTKCVLFFCGFCGYGSNIHIQNKQFQGSI